MISSHRVASEATREVRLPGDAVVDCLSDLHLHPGGPLTLAALERHLVTTPADWVMLLGDVFEVWVGDDALDEADAFEARCADMLAAACARRPMAFMVGNRDFLAGAGLMARTGMVALDDPSVLQIGRARAVLSHGDALCLADEAYQRFRRTVRGPAWQQQFLSQPLAQRRDAARRLREESQQHQRALPHPQADADAELSRQWLHDLDARVLVHGHTHRPADHDLGHGLSRLVLSDWDLDQTPARAQALRLRADGPRMQAQRISLADGST